METIHLDASKTSTGEMVWAGASLIVPSLSDFTGSQLRQLKRLGGDMKTVRLPRKLKKAVKKDLFKHAQRNLGGDKI